ncbi:MAG: Glu-tRNA(Gln) amidotransferase subunit GatD [Acidilobaceae archaeon]
MDYYGYRGFIARILSSLGLEPGDYVRIIKSNGLVIEGVLLPRYSLVDEPILVVKLKNGYNIGIRVDESDVLEKIGRVERGSPGAPVPLAESIEVGDKHVFILGCGGTVASRIDYETGAVKPYISPEELTLSIPELLKYASIDAEQLFSILSEDMKPWMWSKIIDETAKIISRGYDGIVITHGTDTMSYTSAALSFAFHRGLPVPVAMTGSQRSSDRPSSDASFNLVAATLVASNAPFAEVTVVMHGESSDTYALAHRGVRIRKMHTSRRDAFHSINARPLARVWPYDGRIEILDWNFRKRGDYSLAVDNGFDEKVAYIKHYPGPIAEIIDILVDKGFHGIVIEGTGFGHVSSDAIESIRRAVESGVPVVVASQTLFGRVNLNVYSTGRKMLEAGVIPVEDMLPEVAYVKLSWVLARTRDLKDVRVMMQANIAGEISLRHDLNLYPRWVYE